MPIVTVLPSGEEVPVKPGETILEGLNASGYAYRIGCRRGGCAFCKVDLRAGEVTYNRPVSAEVLTPEEIAAGTCLSCRAVPSGDVTIELRGDTLRMTNRMLRDLRVAAYTKAHPERDGAVLTGGVLPTGGDTAPLPTPDTCTEIKEN